MDMGSGNQLHCLVLCALLDRGTGIEPRGVAPVIR
jgi:hypothetical protein